MCLLFVFYVSVDRARVVFKERVNKVAFIKAEKVSHKTRQDCHVGGASMCVCVCVSYKGHQSWLLIVLHKLKLADVCMQTCSLWQTHRVSINGWKTDVTCNAVCVMLLEDIHTYIHTYLHACTHTYIHTQYTHIHHNFLAVLIPYYILN